MSFSLLLLLLLFYYYYLFAKAAHKSMCVCRLIYCISSKCPPPARAHALRRASSVSMNPSITIIIDQRCSKRLAGAVAKYRAGIK